MLKFGVFELDLEACEQGKPGMRMNLVLDFLGSPYP
jgi:hypothetical protein